MRIRGCSLNASGYLLLCPRLNFFTFFFADPRAPVRLPLGAAFLRAARFAFFRSSVANFFVFAIIPFLALITPWERSCLFQLRVLLH